MKLELEDAEDLEEQLHEYDGLSHLRVKKRADSLVIYSGDSKSSQKHASSPFLGGFSIAG